MMIIISIENWKLTYLCHCWRSLHHLLPLACLEPAEQLKVEKLTAGVEQAAGQLLSPATPSQLAENIYFLFILNIYKEIGAIMGIYTCHETFCRHKQN